MKILITGSTGLLGPALVKQLAPIGEVTGISRNPPEALTEQRHRACDLRAKSEVGEMMRSLTPDVVVHAQAWSDVDACEKDPGLARLMNMMAIAHVAEALPPESLLLFISTDYVFDGSKGSAYDEKDAPKPLGAYGASKLEGERSALKHPRGVVVRPSTLFGPGRANFCDHIVSRLKARQPVEAFEDQVTSPTYTHDMAEGVRELILALRGESVESMLPERVVHLTNAGGASRVALAKQVARLIGEDEQWIHPIPMGAQRRPAARPAYSALTSCYLKQVIGRSLRSWEEALEAYLRERQWIH